jgi:hypothetical protein
MCQSNAAFKINKKELGNKPVSMAGHFVYSFVANVMLRVSSAQPR